jgi:signal transduction histidine kinase
MRCVRIASEPVSATVEQGGCPGGIAPQRMREPDGELRETLPQIPLVRRRGFPRSLEYLVRLERVAPVEQALRFAERLGRAEGEALRHALDAGLAAGQRATEGITRAGVTWSAEFVPVALDAHIHHSAVRTDHGLADFMPRRAAVCADWRIRLRHERPDLEAADHGDGQLRVRRGDSAGKQPARWGEEEGTPVVTSAFGSAFARRPTPAGALGRRLTVLSRTTVLLAGLAGALGVLGWLFGIDRLRQVFPGQPYIRFNPALCLVVVALAWFLPTYLRMLCIAFVALLALLTLVEYLFGTGLGVDQLFVSDPSATVRPGRMAVATAASFVLIAAALVLADLGRRRAARWCGIVVVVVSALTLLGYVYNVSWLDSIRPISSIAVHTALSLLLLGVGILAMLPNAEMRWVLQSDDAGAILTRRLLPAALVGLPVVGALALFGERHDLYDGTTTAAVIVGAGALVVGGVTWAAAERLSRIDGKRTAALAELTQLKIDLERQVEQRAAQLQRRHNEIAVLEDRQRIAADLHDIVIQRLFAAGMFLQGAPTDENAATRRRLDTAVEAMDAAIKDLRESIFELGGRRTLRVDLTTAVDDICIDSARVLGFTPELTVDDPHSAADTVRDDLLAVLREALANVARHARASAVQVVLRADSGVVLLEVTDNGVGMTGSGRDSGTRNLVQRARAHGGECTWTALEPHGTKLRWCIPVDVTVQP